MARTRRAQLFSEDGGDNADVHRRPDHSGYRINSGFKLSVLYKSHAQFVKEWTKAVNEAVAAGYFRSQDAKAIIQSASTSDIGK